MWLPITIGAVAVFAALNYVNKAVNTAKLLTYSLTQFKHWQTTATETTFNAGIRIINPGTATLAFQQFAFQIILGQSAIANGVVSGRAQNGNNGRLEPGENEILFPVRVSHLNAVRELVPVIDNLIKKKPQTVSLTIKGVIYAGGVTVPVEQNFKINLK
jgi:hypothetical protein